MYRSEVISVLYEQNFISFYINTLGPFSRALSHMPIVALLIHLAFSDALVFQKTNTRSFVFIE